ncbi:MAG: hypothetical protein R3B57_13455 [Phycisphaerales bacterium]
MHAARLLHSLLLPALVVLTPTVLAQGVRDPSDPRSSRTDADHVPTHVLQQQEYNIVLAGLVETFEAGPGADVKPAVARELLALAADRFVTSRWERDWPTVAAFAREHDLLTHPSPIVRGAATMAIIEGENLPPDANAGVRELLAELVGKAKPPIFIAELGVSIRAICERQCIGRTRDAVLDLTLSEYERAFTAPGLTRAERRLIYSHATYTLGDVLPERVTSPFFERLARAEGVDLWLLLAAKGAHDVDRAWDQRGSRYANDTPPEKLEAFLAALPSARAELEEAFRIDPLCPEPATQLIQLSMGEGERALERTWFDHAVRAQADYTPAHAFMLNALRPRWGGSLEEMREFALEIARQELPGTTVPNQAYMLLEAIILEDGPESARDWRQDELTVAAFLALERLAEDPIQGVRERLWRTRIAALAHVIGHDQYAAEQVRALDGNLHRLPLETYGLLHRDFVSVVLPRENRAGAAYDADELERAERYSEAVPVWERALADADAAGDELMVRAVRTRLLRARRTATLLEGGWVEVEFDDDLTGVVPVEPGRWTRVDERTVRVTLGADRASALLDLDVPLPYEVEVDTRIDYEPTYPVFMSSGVLAAGEARPGMTRFARVEAGPFESGGSFFLGSRDADGSASFILNVPGYEGGAKGFHLRARFDGEHYQVWVDGEEVVHAAGPVSLRRLSGPLVGLSASWGNRSAGFEFSNMRVRHVPEEELGTPNRRTPPGQIFMTWPPRLAP